LSRFALYKAGDPSGDESGSHPDPFILDPPAIYLYTGFVTLAKPRGVNSRSDNGFLPRISRMTLLKILDFPEMQRIFSHFEGDFLHFHAPRMQFHGHFQ
jgi:hypothetical protein